jgi:hypothetical protein
MGMALTPTEVIVANGLPSFLQLGRQAKAGKITVGWRRKCVL